LLKGKRMEPVFLMRLSRTLVIASGSTARGAAGFELDVRGVSYLVCHRRFTILLRLTLTL
jgi:hypothetical protein